MSACRIISVFNQKGGVGKTTTAVNLAAALSLTYRKKVLLIDLDPQAHATCSLLKKPPPDDSRSLYHCLSAASHPSSIAEIIRPTEIEGLDLVPADIYLSELEVELASRIGRETVLADRLRSLHCRYDYIFIDCQPSLGLLPVNALAASTHVIVPVECQFLSLKGFQHLAETVELVRRKINPKLQIMGILPTQFHPRSRANQEVLNYLKRTLAKTYPVFRTFISRDVRAEESPGQARPLLLYAPRCRAAAQYLALAREVVRK